MMTELDQLLAHPVDQDRRMVRMLPRAVFGVLLPVETACGFVSRSAGQTSDTVVRARRFGDVTIKHLTDADVVWLLVNGWEPMPGLSWITQEKVHW